MLERWMEFVAKGVTWTAAAAAFGASALNHEIGDNSMEDQAIVIVAFLFLAGARVLEFLSTFGKPDEVGHGLRRFFLQQPDDDVALRGFKNGIGSCGTAH